MKVVYEPFTETDAVLYFLKEDRPDVFVAAEFPSYAHLTCLLNSGMGMDIIPMKKKQKNGLVSLSLSKTYVLNFEDKSIPVFKFTPNRKSKLRGEHKVIDANTRKQIGIHDDSAIEITVKKTIKK